MRAILILVVAVTLAGCGNLSGYLENRIACTAAGDRAMVVSMWGVVGVASDVRAADAQRVCRAGG